MLDALSFSSMSISFGNSEIIVLSLAFCVRNRGPPTEAQASLRYMWYDRLEEALTQRIVLHLREEFICCVLSSVTVDTFELNTIVSNKCYIFARAVQLAPSGAATSSADTSPANAHAHAHELPRRGAQQSVCVQRIQVTRAALLQLGGCHVVHTDLVAVN